MVQPAEIQTLMETIISVSTVLILFLLYIHTDKRQKVAAFML